MKRIMTLAVAVVSGLLLLASAAMAQGISVPYGSETDVGGAVGEVPVAEPVAQVAEPVAQVAEPGAAGALAQTGLDVTVGAVLALALLILGGLALTAARRRSNVRA